MRTRKALRRFTLLATFTITASSVLAQAPVANDYLKRGAIADGEKALTEHLATHTDDDQAWFGLGVVRLVGTVEGLVQALYRHGLRTPEGLADPVPLFGIANHPEPQLITYTKAGQILKDWLAGLANVNEALSHIDSDTVKLPIDFAGIRIDVDADGEATDAESFWRILQGLDGGRRPAEEVPPLLIHFDKGDAHWLAGYCHLLSVPAEILLAYDNRESFGTLGRLLFPKVDSGTPIDRVPLTVRRPGDGGIEAEMIAEAVAAIHCFDWKVDEPQRLTSALVHLESVVAESRLSWAAILAEKDDDHEWIPNPEQSSIIGVPVSAEQVGAWAKVVDEIEDVLKGDTLIPHWRFPEDEGVNLRRMFTEPRNLDLVMIIHGAGIVPYLEKGEVTDAQTWRALTRSFDGSFLGFAAWFN